eukprot:COSAG05_NODE_9073_length_649_cov_1.407273_2_plen_20_part_01
MKLLYIIEVADGRLVSGLWF